MTNRVAVCRWYRARSTMIAGAMLGSVLTVAAVSVPSWAQLRSNAESAIELVDPDVFRVCADPHNLPFSNEQGEGFENKLATMLAQKLGKRSPLTSRDQPTLANSQNQSAFCRQSPGLLRGE